MNVGITCGMCLQTSDFDLFCVSPLGLPLPKHHYQCPVCNEAFALKAVTKPIVFESGMVIPSKIEIVHGQASL